MSPDTEMNQQLDVVLVFIIFGAFSIICITFYFIYLLISQDDINEIPFFDTTVPREVAMKIFQHLDMKSLCMCSQVRREWRMEVPQLNQRGRGAQLKIE